MLLLSNEMFVIVSMTMNIFLAAFLPTSLAMADPQFPDPIMATFFKLEAIFIPET